MPISSTSSRFSGTKGLKGSNAIRFSGDDKAFAIFASDGEKSQKPITSARDQDRASKEQRLSQFAGLTEGVAAAVSLLFELRIAGYPPVVIKINC